MVLTADVPLQEGQIYESDLVLSLPIIEASHEGKNDSEIRMKIQDMWRR